MYIREDTRVISCVKESGVRHHFSIMKIEDLARPNVLDIEPYKPGKPIEPGFIKMASNESPLGPSIKAQEAIRKSIKNLSLYPEGSGLILRETIARQWKVRPDNVILGNGSNEIIELILHAFLNEGEEVITCRPSFLVYFLSAKVFNAKLIEVPLKYYTYDLDEIANRITPKTKVIFIANPNNPTGTMVDKDSVSRFMEKVPGHVVVAFDEAYGEFANPKVFPKTIKYIDRPVIMLRTFSKIYGLAGLRIGYGVADSSIVELLNKVRQPFNVNSLAQVAATAALGDEDYRHRMIALIEEGRRYLYNEFYKLGLFYVPSEANFILVKVNKFQDLLKKGVIVRPMEEYDLPEFIRVTVGTMHQNRRFIKALREVLL